MVQSFDLEFEVVPQLKTPKEISLKRGDTLIAKIDQEKYDLNDAHAIYQILAKAFPNNQVIVLFNGIELEVIKDDTD